MFEGRRPIARYVGLGPVLVAALGAAAPAEAHIKWFAPYDVAAQPQPLHDVIANGFWPLVLAGMVILWTLSQFERSALGATLNRAMAQLGAGIRNRTEDYLRAGTGAFFVALFVVGNIILTPELLTGMSIVPWLQAAIALGMLWRPSMVVSAAGIAALYAYGTLTYGVFHMMDYPIFLGLAGYLALTAARVRILDFRAIDVARWAAAITLMWASVEKWAYPEWTYPVLNAHPELSFGFSPSFYMSAAGFMEFSLAFALLWTPMVRTLAATVLAAMFVSAVFEFGKIDAIGHLMIIVILITVGADDAKTPRRPALAPVSYGATLAGFLALYYGVHAMIYGTTIW